MMGIKLYNGLSGHLYKWINYYGQQTAKLAQ